MMKPPIPTLSPVRTRSRVERLIAFETGLGLGVGVPVGAGVTPGVVVGAGVGVGVGVDGTGVGEPGGTTDWTQYLPPLST